MRWTEVQSSNVRRVAHDAAEDVLLVEFSSGGTYQYQGVPEDVFKTLLESESVGRFLSERIKPFHYFEAMDAGGV